eukprot:Blabericola_migrator_1__2850@NODE_1816_length_3743_cov_264_731230_g1166_i0_p4_GENE_NODE_1816_length_3743_cov_264_731230_g1166_i0NODE_1816_length_3743_cov_264_731230_g1166_i0_p4_ORF_typecomplete_len132_score4_66_NODE_1816_length_3743_cov_264_731230_g1166_i012521647
MDSVLQISLHPWSLPNLLGYVAGSRLLRSHPTNFGLQISQESVSRLQPLRVLTTHAYASLSVRRSGVQWHGHCLQYCMLLYLGHTSAGRSEQALASPRPPDCKVVTKSTSRMKKSSVMMCLLKLSRIADHI